MMAARGVLRPRGPAGGSRRGQSGRARPAASRLGDATTRARNANTVRRPRIRNGRWELIGDETPLGRGEAKWSVPAAAMAVKWQRGAERRIRTGMRVPEWAPRGAGRARGRIRRRVLEPNVACWQGGGSANSLGITLLPKRGDRRGDAWQVGRRERLRAREG